MRIRELTFLPTGEALVDRGFDTAALDHDTLAHHEKWWRAAASPSETLIDTPAGPLAVKFTFVSTGQALGTWSLSGSPVLSSLLLAGIEPGADAELTDMFLTSMRNVNPVKRLAAEQRPFEAIRNVADRPLVAGVVWQFVPLDQYQKIAPATMSIVASFFRSRPNAGAEP